MNAANTNDQRLNEWSLSKQLFCIFQSYEDMEFTSIFFFVCTPVCEQTVAHQHERYSAADMNADAERRHFCRIIYKIKNSTNCDHEEFSLIRQVGRPDCDVRLTHSTGIGRVRCRYKYKCA